jgi:ketosteroid isomerase-like protein
MSTVTATDVVATYFAALLAQRYEEAAALLHDDVLWSVPGRSPVAGEYRGREAVLGYHRQLAELGGDDLNTEVGGVLADESHAVVWLTRTSQDHNRPLLTRECHLFRVKDGLIVEFTGYQHDQYAADRWFEGSH